MPTWLPHGWKSLNRNSNAILQLHQLQITTKKREASPHKTRIFARRLEYLGNGLSCQGLLKRLLCFPKVHIQCALNIPANQTIRVRLAMMLRDQVPILHRTVKLQQRDRGRLAHEMPAPTDPRLRSYQPRPAERPHDAPDKHRVRVDAPRDKLRSHRLVT
jgi:hypothetical protein